MDKSRQTRLQGEIAKYIRHNSESILAGWEELMRPVVGETITGQGIRSRTERLLEIFADLLEGESYDPYSNYIRRLFIDLISAGYGPSWISETLDLFIEYISQEVAGETSNGDRETREDVSAELRNALHSFITGEAGYRVMRDLALVSESHVAEVTEHRDSARQERELLLKITGALHSAMSKREIFSNLLPVLTELIPASQAAAVMLFDGDRILRLMEVYNLDDFQPVKAEIELNDSIYRDILLGDEACILERSKLPEKTDLVFRRASTVGEKVLRAQPLSVAIMPVQVSKQPFGGIALFNYAREGSFKDVDLSLLKVVTGQLTSAIERVMYSEKASRQHRRIKTVLEMAETLRHGQPPREVAEAILGIVRRAIDFTRGMIFHLTEGGNIVPTGAIDVEAPLDVRGLDAPEKPGQFLVLPLQREETIYLKDLSSPGPFSDVELPVPVKGVKQGSLIISPLVIDRDPVGLLLMYHKEPHAFDDEEIDLIRVICQQGAHFLLRALEYKRYVGEQAIKDDEQRRSQRMQHTLFPVSFRLEGWEAQISLIQASQLAGDFAVIRSVPDGLLAAVGSVSGYGPPAGLIMMRAYGLVQEIFMTIDDPGKTLSEMNTILHDQFEGPSRRFQTTTFVNCALAKANTRGRIRFALAGSPPPIIFHSSTGEVFEPEVSGIPLGIESDVDYMTTELKLSRGDKLLLYSDGLITCDDASGKPFRLEELKELFKRAGRFPARVILDLIEGAIRDEGADDRVGHDRTSMVIASEDKHLKRLSFKGEDEERESACDTALKAVRRRTEDRDLLFAVRLALHEIVKNAIEHGNHGNTSLKVHLTYLVGEDFVHLAVRDSGTGFDPALLKSGLGSAGILKDKGRGFMMVKQLMDKVWYDPSVGEINLFTRFPIPEA